MVHRCIWVRAAMLVLTIPVYDNWKLHIQLIANECCLDVGSHEGFFLIVDFHEILKALLFSNYHLYEVSLKSRFYPNWKAARALNMAIGFCKQMP